MNSSTATATRPVRGGAPARLLRAVLTGLSDGVHAAGDAQARALGWTVTPVPGPLGLGGRAYRHPAFGPGTANREGRTGPERRPRHPGAVGEAQPAAARPGPPAGRQDFGDA
jgi:hypothetical protein